MRESAASTSSTQRPSTAARDGTRRRAGAMISAVRWRRVRMPSMAGQVAANTGGTRVSWMRRTRRRARRPSPTGWSRSPRCALGSSASTPRVAPTCTRPSTSSPLRSRGCIGAATARGRRRRRARSGWECAVGALAWAPRGRTRATVSGGCTSLGCRATPSTSTASNAQPAAAPPACALAGAARTLIYTPSGRTKFPPVSPPIKAAAARGVRP